VEQVQEVVLVRYTAAQNKAQTDMTYDFYKLPEKIDVSKDLFVTKASYQKYLNAQMRQRTPYQADKKFSDFSPSEQNFPFLVSYTKVYYTFPSGRKLTLTEYLTEPNGLTKSVELEDSGGEKSTYNKFLDAEVEVIERFLAEIKG
jgi:hypothetical protein